MSGNNRAGHSQHLEGHSAKIAQNDSFQKFSLCSPSESEVRKTSTLDSVLRKQALPSTTTPAYYIPTASSEVCPQDDSNKAVPLGPDTSQAFTSMQPVEQASPTPHLSSWCSEINHLSSTRPKDFTNAPFLSAQLNAATFLPVHKDKKLSMQVVVDRLRRLHRRAFVG